MIDFPIYIAGFVAPVVSAISAIASTTIGGAILGAALSVGVSFVANALFGKKKKKPSQIDGVFEDTRTVMVKEAAASRKVIYGQVKTSGVIGFLETTDDDKKLHNVLCVAGHEVESFDEVYFNQDLLPGVDSGSGSSISVSSGTYDGVARVNFHLGTDAQTADSNLVSEVTDWTTNHRLRGIAYLYTRFTFDEEVYPNGMPTIRTVVKGKKLYDTRTSTTAYSNNPALAVYDYLTNTDYGVGVSTSDIDTTSFNTAANTCEESVPQLGETVLAAQPVNATGSNALLTFNVLNQKGFNMAHNGTGATTRHGYVAFNTALTAGTTYVVNFTVTENSGSVGSDLFCHFATTALDSTASTVEGISAGANSFEITAASPDLNGLVIRCNAVFSGDLDITDIRVAPKLASENRYECNGVIDTENDHATNLEALLSSCAGKLLYNNGQFRLVVGDYVTPTITLDENDAAGPISVKTALPAAETFNAVKGTFIDPNRDWQAADYPSLVSSSYVTQDGETKFTDYSLPMTTSASMARRLAKIKLLQSRQTLQVTMPCKLTAYNLQVGDTVQVNNTQFGWSSKVFEVERLEFSYDDTLGVTLSLRETASAIYDWSTSEDISVDPAPNTNLATPYPITTPVRVVSALPTTENYEGRTVHLTTDNKTYRYDGSSFVSTTSADDLTAGTVDGEEIVIAGGASGLIKSDNYSAGSAGWQIDGAGDAEFNDVTIRGKVSNTGSFFNDNSTNKNPFNAIVKIDSQEGFRQFASDAGPFYTTAQTLYGVDSSDGSADETNRIAGDEVVCFIVGEIHPGANGHTTTDTDAAGTLQFTVQYKIGAGSWTDWFTTPTDGTSGDDAYARIGTDAGNQKSLVYTKIEKPTWLSGNETSSFQFRMKIEWIAKSSTSASHEMIFYGNFRMLVFNTSS